MAAHRKNVRLQNTEVSGNHRTRRYSDAILDYGKGARAGASSARAGLGSTKADSGSTRAGSGLHTATRAGIHAASRSELRGRRASGTGQKARGKHADKKNIPRHGGAPRKLNFKNESMPQLPQLHETYSSHSLSLSLGDLSFRPTSLLMVAVVALVIFILIRMVACSSPVPTNTENKAATFAIKDTGLFYPDSTFFADLLIPEALAPTRPGKALVSGTNKDGGSASDELSQAIGTIEHDGYEVGFALLDVDTGITISYNANSSFYSASSIKGPYVVSLAEFELGDEAKSAESERIENIITWSDNASYSSLSDSYGRECFEQLVEASGAATLAASPITSAIEETDSWMLEGGIADNLYEYLSPNQMLALWKECYSYLCAGSASAQWLGELFSEPETSAIRVVASSLGTTWSKAGWYAGGGDAYDTTVDAGVIRTSTGDVIVCVMTNEPENFTCLQSILTPLLNMRAALTS